MTMTSYRYIWMSFYCHYGWIRVLLLGKMLLKLWGGCTKSGTTLFETIVSGRVWMGGTVV